MKNDDNSSSRSSDQYMNSPDFFVVSGAINEEEDLLSKHKHTPTNFREHADHIRDIQTEKNQYYGFEEKYSDADIIEDRIFDPEDEEIGIDQLLWYKRVMKWTNQNR